MIDTITSQNIDLSSWIIPHHRKLSRQLEALETFSVYQPLQVFKRPKKKQFKQVMCLAARGISVSIFK